MMRISIGRAGALRGWMPRAAALPAIGVALLPKCPLCIMMVFGALGLSHPLHDTVFSALQAATLAIMVSLLVVKRRAGVRTRIVGTAGACGIMLGSLGFVRPELGYAGAVLLAGAWLVKRRAEPVSSCGCAASASTAAAG